MKNYFKKSEVEEIKFQLKRKLMKHGKSGKKAKNKIPHQSKEIKDVYASFTANS